MNTPTPNDDLPANIGYECFEYAMGQFRLDYFQRNPEAKTLRLREDELERVLRAWLTQQRERVWSNPPKVEGVPRPAPKAPA